MWPTFAAEALLYGAPERFAAVMAVGEFVERFLQEAVTMQGGRLIGRADHRRHVAHARFLPRTRTGRWHITGLCDFETVSEHAAAFWYL